MKKGEYRTRIVKNQRVRGSRPHETLGVKYNRHRCPIFGTTPYESYKKTGRLYGNEIHHNDGNYKNNDPNNETVVSPNGHSALDNKLFHPDKYIDVDKIKSITCAVCGLNNIDVFNRTGYLITMELHHKNGDRTDNSPENTPWECPNCHSGEPNSNVNKNKYRFPIYEMIVMLEKGYSINMISRLLRHPENKKIRYSKSVILRVCWSYGLQYEFSQICIIPNTIKNKVLSSIKSINKHFV